MKTSLLRYLGTLIFVLSLANTGCSGVGFSESKGSDATNTGQDTGGDDREPDRDVGDIDTTTTTCTTAINNITYPLKITFLVDASGSNSSWSNEKSDPDRNFRYYSIASFLTKFAAKTNFTYQMVHFKDSSASTYINSSSSNLPYFGSSTEMWSAIDYFKSNISDDGYTPYKAAFNATKYVHTHSGTDAPNTRYVTILVTDGMPTDFLKTVNDPTGHSVVWNNNNGTYEVVDENAILADVTNVIGIKAGISTLSTVYYGRNNQTYTAAAKQRLKNIAATGSGKFFDASLSEQIHIEDTISIPGLVCTGK